MKKSHSISKATIKKKMVKNKQFTIYAKENNNKIALMLFYPYFPLFLAT